jgi:hypothetical protein
MPLKLVTKYFALLTTSAFSQSFDVSHEVFPVCSEYLAKLPIASSASLGWRNGMLPLSHWKRSLLLSRLYFLERESMNLCIMPDMSAVAKTAPLFGLHPYHPPKYPSLPQKQILLLRTLACELTLPSNQCGKLDE